MSASTVELLKPDMLFKSGPMRSFPDTETNRERGEGIRIPNWLSGQSSKLAQIWALERAGF